jgi:glucosylceramidase
MTQSRRTAQRLFLILCVCFALTPALLLAQHKAMASGETVKVWLTTSDLTNAITPQNDLSFATDGTTGDINVNENQQYQSIDGFGAAMTDSSAALINNSPQKDAIMGKLFDWQHGGIGMSFMRVPIGASDFIAAPSPTPAWYTYDDVPAGQTDTNLSQFSIDHDKAYITPLLKQALQLNSGLKLVASPWSPPAWMKTGGTLLGRNGGTLSGDAYEAYAQYFVKFIQAYQNEGVPVYAVTPQNEPATDPTYPGMEFSATDEANFIKNNLGPDFANANINTKILAWDHNWNSQTDTLSYGGTSYADAVLGDPGAAQYVDGSAWHCYEGSASSMTDEHNNHPDKSIYETECSPGCGGISAAPLIISSVQNWAKGALLWNIALRPDGGPDGPDGRETNCLPLISIDSNGNPTYRSDFYQVGQFSQFLGASGTYRIGGSSTGTLQAVSFKNADGSKVVVAYNSGSSDRAFKVAWGNQSFNYTLPAGAMATFRWSGSTNYALDRTNWVAQASSSNTNEGPTLALDGNTSTRWASGQQQSNGQYYQIDLGSAQNFSRIVLDNGTDTTDYPRGYQVYVSNTPSDWGDPVATGSGSGALTDITFSQQNARYIKIVQTGSTSGSTAYWWCIYELNIYP